uniref:PHD-type domain-containing protein n=1 Tax=Arcella intermedia TaxID=1963864 RepID=A0A6B2L0R8_9EUKA
MIMDYLEKESFKQKEFAQLAIEAKKPSLDLNEDEDDIPCCVCNDRDYHEGNLIVFCDGCDIAIHQDCQGLKEIPEGLWFCDRCQFFEDDSDHSKSSKQADKGSKKTPRKGKKKRDTTYKEEKPTKSKKKSSSSGLSSREKAKKEKLLTTVICSMCHQSGGAMKRTTAKDWIHVLCAYWIPEFFFDKNYAIVNVENISYPRMELVCSVCNKPGGCVQCGKGACVVAYHPTCAQINSHYMAIEEKKNKGKKRKRESNSEAILVSYCKNHTVMKQNEALEKAIINGKAKVLLGRFMDIYSKHEVQKRLGFSIPKQLLHETCSYWINKRHQIGEGRRPLIRRLLIETEDEKKRQEIESEKKRYLLKERSDMDKYKTLRLIRADLERGRTVIDVLRKREKMKLERLKNLQEVWTALYEHTFPPPPLVLKFKLLPEICNIIGVPYRAGAVSPDPPSDPRDAPSSPNSVYESQSASPSPPMRPFFKEAAHSEEESEIDVETKQGEMRKDMYTNRRTHPNIPLTNQKKAASSSDPQSHSPSPSHSRSPSSSPREEDPEDNFYPLGEEEEQ